MGFKWVRKDEEIMPKGSGKALLVSMANNEFYRKVISEGAMAISIGILDLEKKKGFYDDITTDILKVSGCLFSFSEQSKLKGETQEELNKNLESWIDDLRKEWIKDGVLGKE